MEKVQHRFARMVPGLKDLPYADRLRALELWSLEMKQGISAVRFHQFFKLNSTRRTRGHHMKIVKQRCRMDIRKYFISKRVVDHWNELDKETINTKIINSFKKALDGVRKAKIDFFTD